jgi:division protein CdvB (Snf7/Vps24/ESCRT-III family)
MSLGSAEISQTQILTEDKGMRRVAAKFVAKLLLLEQQQLRLEVAQDMLECANRDPEFLKTMITGDPAVL